MELIEYWRCTRPISVMAAVAAHGIGAFVSCGADVFIVQVIRDQIVRGFSVFSCPNETVCVNIMSFSEKYTGSRLEDAMIWRTIEFAGDRGSKKLHLGYAGNDSLAKFKEKWGGRKTGPEYRQAMYASTPAWNSRAEKYDFFWTSRLLNPHPTEIPR